MTNINPIFFFCSLVCPYQIKSLNPVMEKILYQLNIIQSIFHIEIERIIVDKAQQILSKY